MRLSSKGCMKTNTKKAMVGGVLATAVAAGAVLLSNKENRKKVAKTVSKAIKSVNTPEVRKRLDQAKNVVKNTQDVLMAAKKPVVSSSK